MSESKYKYHGIYELTFYKCDDDGEIMEDENGDFIICGYFKNGIANFI